MGLIFLRYVEAGGPVKEAERRSKGEARYRQEYLCEFVAPEGALFDEEAIRRLIVDDFDPVMVA